jgi:hypothetical protein
MYATLVGLIVIVAGVFLYTFVTSCGTEGPVAGLTRKVCLEREYLNYYYDYRPYGLALIVLGLIFIYGVYRSASQEAQSE